MKKKHSKLSNIIIILCIFPFILLLLVSIYCSFAGFSFMYNTLYGLEAFNASMVLYGYKYLPVFIISIILLIIVLIKRK